MAGFRVDGPGGSAELAADWSDAATLGFMLEHERNVSGCSGNETDSESMDAFGRAMSHVIGAGGFAKAAGIVGGDAWEMSKVYARMAVEVMVRRARTKADALSRYAHAVA